MRKMADRFSLIWPQHVKVFVIWVNGDFKGALSEVTLYSAHLIFIIMYSDSAAIDCDDHEDYMLRFCFKLVISEVLACGATELYLTTER